MEWSDGKILFKGDTSEMLELMNATQTKPDTLFPQKQLNIPSWVFWIFMAIYPVVACLFWIFADNLSKYDGVLLVILIALAGCLIVACHGYIKNWFATIVCIFLSVVVMLVSLRYTTPEEAGNEIKKRTDQVLDKHVESTSDIFDTENNAHDMN